MTDQELFDKVAQHLLTQNSRAVVAPVPGEPLSGFCRYRTPDGKQCAAGCLITDDNYSPAFEGCTVYGSPVRSALLRSGVMEHQTRLVHRLQKIHDDTLPKTWREGLKQLALDWGLEFHGPE